MPAPYGVFTRNILINNQPDPFELDYFVSKMVEDASNASTNTYLNNATVGLQERLLSFQEIQNSVSSNQVVISIAPEQEFQSLYDDAAYRHHKTLTQWFRVVTITTTIKNEPLSNNDEIKKIHKEIINLLTLNKSTYTNDSIGQSTEIYSNNTSYNRLISQTVLNEVETSKNRIGFLQSKITILFKIYKT
jgi:hypothetical protein